MNGVEKAVNGVTALGTIIMHIVLSIQLTIFLKSTLPCFAVGNDAPLGLALASLLAELL